MSNPVRSVFLALIAQLATYKKRLWEPILILVAIFIASAGLTAVTLINLGASSQLNQFTIGDTDISWQVVAKRAETPVTPADYAKLRRKGFDTLVAYTQSETGELALDSLALLGILPIKSEQSDNNLSDQATDYGLQDLNQYYRGSVTPASHPLTGLAIVGNVTPQLKNNLLKVLPDHLTISRLELKSSANNLTDSFSLNLWAMGALMLLVSVFIVFNALNLLLAARTPLLIKLRQLGIGKSVLLQVVLFEMLLLTSIGAVCGVFTGASVITRFSPVLSKIYQFLLDGQFNDGGLSIGQLVFYSLLLSVLAVVGMSVLVNQRLEKSLAHRSKMVAAFSRPFNSQYGYALLIIIVVLTAGALFISSQLQALLYIGLVLLTGCASVVIFMPALMHFAAKRSRPEHPLIHWSLHNAVSLSQRTRLAACAFFIALAANIGMNVMVDSFREATEQWLEQRLFAPFYIYTDFENDLSTLESAPVQILARYGKDIRVQGNLTEIRSFPDDPVFQPHLMLDKSVDSAWADFYAQKGVYINQQMAYRRALKMGDVLNVPTGEGFQTKLVLGVYPDFGNPKAQILLPESVLKPWHDQISAYAAFAKPQQQALLEDWLENIDPQARLVAREVLIKQSMMVFSKTFMTTDTLNLVTMVVAALSFFVSITLLIMDIKPQLLLLRSAGVSAIRIKLSLLAQYLFIAITCAFLALPFALLLAWLLVNKVNRFAFHWTYPLILEPIVILQSVLIGLAVLLALMALPLGKLEAKFHSQQGAL